jgi:Ca2+-binding RTX toxin-like protein
MSLNIAYSRTAVLGNLHTNTFTYGNQLMPDVLGVSNGGFVAAYGNDYDNDIRLDFYDADFSTIGTFAEVGADSASGQPSLTELANGNVLVTWEGHGNIRARLFSTDGDSLSQSPIPLTPANLIAYDPQVVALAGGGFVLTYSDGEIHHALFDNAGNLQDNHQITNALANVADPSVAALADGGYCITYSVGNDIRATICNADGSLRKADFVVAAAGQTSQPEVVGLPNGNWAVVYRGFDLAAEGDSSGIALQIFDPLGVNVTPNGIQKVNTAGAANESSPDVTVLENGFIVVTWTKPVAGTTDIYARVYDQNGQVIVLNGNAGEFPIARGHDTSAAISALIGGQFITSWQDYHAGDERVTSTITELARIVTGDGADDLFVGDVLGDIVDGGQGSDTIFGLGGNDLLQGGAGVDTVSGGAGDDTIFGMTEENPGGAGVGDTLTGDAGNDTITGSGGGDTIDGGTGSDSLDGGLGADSMSGGTQNDNYTVDNIGDAATELANEGYDIVNTTLGVYSLAGNVERVNFTGAGNFVGSGNVLDNRLLGGAGDDRFVTSVGADIYQGGAGVDTVDYRTAASGATLNFATDVIAGAAAGDVFGSIEKFLGSTIANDAMTGAGNGRFVFAGYSGADTLVGGANIDRLLGGAGDDQISGAGGIDTLIGEAGNDTMTGGAGGDLFVYAAGGFGQDAITDFQDGFDKLKVHSSVADAFADFSISGNGTSGVTIALAADPAQTITLQGSSPMTISAADFLFY